MLRLALFVSHFLDFGGGGCGGRYGALLVFLRLGGISAAGVARGSWLSLLRRDLVDHPHAAKLPSVTDAHDVSFEFLGPCLTAPGAVRSWRLAWQSGGEDSLGQVGVQVREHPEGPTGARRGPVAEVRMGKAAREQRTTVMGMWEPDILVITRPRSSGVDMENDFRYRLLRVVWLGSRHPGLEHVFCVLR